MNVELHLRHQDPEARLYEVTVDGKALLGIALDSTRIDVIAWDNNGDAVTVWDICPDDLYNP